MIFKLIRLETMKNSLKPYVIASIVITVATIGMLYLFAAVPYIDPSDSDVQIFKSYRGIFILTLIVSMACFSILSAVIYNKYVINEYCEKNVYLIFSYPINRKNILLAKIATVFMFSYLAMLVSGIVTFLIFYLSEKVFPLYNERITIISGFKFGIYLVLFAALGTALSVYSLYIGYRKRSTSVTIISNVIIVSIFGSSLTEIILAEQNFDFIILFIVTIISILGAFAIFFDLSKRITELEV